MNAKSANTYFRGIKALNSKVFCAHVNLKIIPRVFNPRKFIAWNSEGHRARYRRTQRIVVTEVDKSEPIAVFHFFKILNRKVNPQMI